MKDLIRAEKLSVGYDRRPLLRNVDLSVPAGRLTVLIGANGSGKTTLVKTLSGLLPPLSGEIFYGERKWNGRDLHDLARRRSFVSSGEMPFGPFSVWDWVATGRLPYSGWNGRLTPVDIEIVEHAIARVGMAGFSGRALNTLSQGELQRVRIAKALAQDTPLMLFDEPFSHLDFPSRVQLFGLVKKLCREDGKGIVVITHELDLALQKAGRIWMIDREGKFYEGENSVLRSGEWLDRLFDTDVVRYDRKTGRFEYID